MNNMNENYNKEEYKKEIAKHQIFRADGNGTILELSNTALAFNKLRINAIRYDKQSFKQIESIDFYLDLEEFARLKHDFNSLKLEEKIRKAIEKKVEYKELFMASGGKQKTAENDPIYRQFTIFVGKNQPYLFTLENGKGEMFGNGLIKRAYQKPDRKISVPISQSQMCYLLDEAERHIQAYRAMQYMIGDLTTEWKRI